MACGKGAGTKQLKQTRFFRFFRRYGIVSFTIYHGQWFLFSLFPYFLTWIGGSAPPFCVSGYGRDTECSTAGKTQCKFDEAVDGGRGAGGKPCKDERTNTPVMFLYIGWTMFCIR